MGDKYDVLASQAEWKDAKKAAKADIVDTTATTLLIVKDIGKEVTAMGKKITAVDGKLDNHVKTDDQRHEATVGMIGEHIGLPAPIAHPNTEECNDGANCGEEEAVEPNAAVRLLTNPTFLKGLSGVLSVLVLVLFGVAGGA